MTPHLVVPNDAPRDVWLKARRGGVTATESPIVLGLSPYESPLGLYLRKRGEIPDPDVTAAMEWGTRLEPVVVAKFADAHPEFDVRPGGGVYRHATDAHRFASPDAELYESTTSTDRLGLFEAKTARAGSPGWGPDGSDGNDNIPVHYAIQVQKQLDVLDVDVAYVAVLIGGQDYREYQLARDLELCDSIRQADDEFWRRLQAGVEPVADFTDATTAALHERYPVADPDQEVVLPPETYDVLAAYEAALRAEKDAGKAKAAATNRLKQLLGDAAVGVLDSQPVVRWGNAPRRSVTDMDKLADAHPEFITVKPGRRLTVKGRS